MWELGKQNSLFQLGPVIKCLLTQSLSSRPFRERVSGRLHAAAKCSCSLNVGWKCTGCLSNRDLIGLKEHILTKTDKRIVQPFLSKM